MYLADLGAEVIKIENREQGGDVARAWARTSSASDDSHFFQTFNLNKKSLTLDLKTPRGPGGVPPAGRRRADAVLNNLRGDQPEKLGLTYAALTARQPADRLRAPLGLRPRQRARAAWPGYDYLMQAEAGYLS